MVGIELVMRNVMGDDVVRNVMGDGIRDGVRDGVTRRMYLP